MNAVDIEKIRKGFNNNRFEYLTGKIKKGDSYREAYMSRSLGGYYVVYSDSAPTKYYKNFIAAIKYFFKYVDLKTAWIDLTWPIEDKFGKADYFLVEDLDWLDDDDLEEVE